MSSGERKERKKRKADGQSVKAVSQLLTKTPEFKALVARIRTSLCSAQITGVKVSIADDASPTDSLNTRVAARVTIGFNGADSTSLSSPTTSFGLDRFYMAADLKRVVEQNFGVREDTRFQRVKVPTYGVGKENITDRFTSKYGPEALREALRDEDEAVCMALRPKIEELLACEETTALRQQAWDNHVVKKIKGVLMQFRGEPKSTIKRAIDEFIVHDILES